MAAEVAAYVPGYRVKGVVFDEGPFSTPGGEAAARVTVFLEVTGQRRLPAAVRGQPGHHDRVRGAGRRGARARRSRRRSRHDGDPRDLRRRQPSRRFRLTDSTLRDGSHALAHQFTPEQVAADRGRARRGRRAGHRGQPRRRPGRLVLQLRLLARTDELRADRGRCRRPSQAGAARGPAAPGHRASPSDLNEVARARRVDRARSPPTARRRTSRIQHLGPRSELGHGDGRVPDAGAHDRRRPSCSSRREIMEDAGADCVYVVDSAGAMTTDDVARPRARRSRRAARRRRRSASTPTTTCALGGRQLDRRARGGRDAGRRLHARPGRRRRQLPDRGARRGLRAARLSRPGVDLLAIMDVAEDVVAPMMSPAAGHRPRRR